MVHKKFDKNYMPTRDETTVRGTYIGRGKLMKVSLILRKRFFFVRVMVSSSICASFCLILFHHWYSVSGIDKNIVTDDYRQSKCSCLESELSSFTLNSTSNLTDSESSLCSHYATRRGPHQRIISVSLFGPKENKMFQLNPSLTFLNELIHDVNKIYPDNFVLRIHHDDTIGLLDVICPIKCRHQNVDFCNMNSKLFIPPKIWRFIPAGDALVDISE